MPRYDFTKPHLLPVLHDQLIAASLPPDILVEIGDAIQITYGEPVDPAALQAVIDAHDVVAIEAAEANAEAAEQTIETEMDTAKAVLIAQGTAAYADLVQMQTDLAVFVTPAHNLSSATFANQAARDLALQNIGKALEPLLRGMIRLAGIQQAILRLEAADHGLKVSP